MCHNRLSLMMSEEESHMVDGVAIKKLKLKQHSNILNHAVLFPLSVFSKNKEGLRHVALQSHTLCPHDEKDSTSMIF